MFIIEGGDNLGKTTAAKRMVELAKSGLNDEFKLPIRYQHMSRPNQHFDFFQDYRDMMGRYAVQDRFHLGALAWHTGVMTHDKLRIIEGWLAGLGGAIVIFVASDDDWYREHLNSHPKDEMFDTDVILAANRRFRNDICYQSHPDLIWDVCTGGFPSDETLEQWLTMWFSRLQHLPRF